MIIKQFYVGLTPNNCNYRLKTLYKRRDRASEALSCCMTLERPTYEDEYNDCVDTIEELCDFRRKHNCALEGDADYRED